jgi:GTP pyrophosphokinase
MEAGGDQDEAIAALLHDAIEDQGDDYPGGREALRERIRSDFGERVLEIVNACTDDDLFPKPKGGTFADAAEVWRKRKEAYLEHLRHVNDRGVLLVSCADKLHNTRSMLRDYRSMGEAVWERFTTQSREDQLWVYRGLCGVYLEKGVGAMAEEIGETLDRLEAVQGRG